MPVTIYAAGLWIVPVILCCLWGAAASNAYGKSGNVNKPMLPRFASLKQQKTNVRVGPGTQYPIRWIYQRQGLPVEIIADFGNWRRIRGSDSSDGWVHAALLSARRTALAAPWSAISVNLRARPSERAAVVARLQPRVLVHVKRCDRIWCAVDVPEHDLQGYVRQVKLWGVYPDELVGRANRQLFNPIKRTE
jgi:SH3-like domain-containing protein